MTCRLAGLIEPTCALPLRNLSMLAFLGWAVLDQAPCRAGDLYAADGLDVRWDNTLRYSAGVRLNAANAALLGNPNSDDGDRDFAPGLVLNRLDLLSVLNVTKGESGIQVSVDGWYDTVYDAHTANNSPATYNALSVPNTKFPRAVRNLDGHHAEFGDTFAYGNFAIGGIPISMRIGRQTLLWGESLFFDENSIAAAQAPIDYIKNVGTPQSYSNNVFLPVDQLSLTAQPRANLALAAYYQFEWRGSRLPGVGSYFSDSDVLGAGAERLLLAQGQYLHRGESRIPSPGGQFGLSFQTRLDDLDLGLYALLFDSKYPILRLKTEPSAASLPNDVGEFYSVYPNAIELYGIGFSGYLENSSVAGEFSARLNTPLVGASAMEQYPPAEAGKVVTSGYARGNTLHAQVSSVTTLPPALVWDSADISVQVSATYLLGVTQNKVAIDPSRLRFASSLRALFEPRYFEVLPNLDVTFPIGLGYGLAGRSEMYFGQNSGAGDFEIGLSATYRSVWKADLILTSYLGAPSRQPLADRDFILFSIERAF